MLPPWRAVDTVVRQWVGAVVVTAVLAGIAGCGSAPTQDDPSTVQDAPVVEDDRATTTSVGEPTNPGAAPVDAGSVVAEAVAPSVEVFDREGDGQPVRVLDRAAEVSGQLVFLVRADPGGERIEVHLPVRPNGSTGWIRRADVRLSAHRYAVEVRLAEHRLVVRNGSAVVLDAPIGVGTTDTPTPGGVFYIKELLRPPDPNGPYGSYAYGLSGYSNELDDFAGGDGVIGIHGTNDPSTIGTDVSHGCIRLANEHIELLVEEIGLPLGTPVEIRA